MLPCHEGIPTPHEAAHEAIPNLPNLLPLCSSIRPQEDPGRAGRCLGSFQLPPGSPAARREPRISRKGNAEAAARRRKTLCLPSPGATDAVSERLVTEASLLHCRACPPHGKPAECLIGVPHTYRGIALNEATARSKRCSQTLGAVGLLWSRWLRVLKERKGEKKTCIEREKKPNPIPNLQVLPQRVKSLGPSTQSAMGMLEPNRGAAAPSGISKAKGRPKKRKGGPSAPRWRWGSGQGASSAPVGGDASREPAPTVPMGVAVSTVAWEELTEGINFSPGIYSGDLGLIKGSSQQLPTGIPSPSDAHHSESEMTAWFPLQTTFLPRNAGAVREGSRTSLVAL